MQHAGISASTPHPPLLLTFASRETTRIGLGVDSRDQPSARTCEERIVTLTLDVAAFVAWQSWQSRASRGNLYQNPNPTDNILLTLFGPDGGRLGLIMSTTSCLHKVMMGTPFCRGTAGLGL